MVSSKNPKQDFSPKKLFIAISSLYTDGTSSKELQYMLPFPIKLKKPRFSSLLGDFCPKNPTTRTCQDIFHPIFRLCATVTSYIKSEKFNALTSYKTKKNHLGRLLPKTSVQKNHLS